MDSILLNLCVAGLLWVYVSFVNNFVRVSWIWLLIIFRAISRQCGGTGAGDHGVLNRGVPKKNVA